MSLCMRGRYEVLRLCRGVLRILHDPAPFNQEWGRCRTMDSKGVANICTLYGVGSGSLTRSKP
jgi:hypothetical protein